MTKHARFFLLPSFILISAALIAGCNDKGEEKAHVGEPQVTVHIVKTAPLEVKTELPGRTNAYRIAEVRPQVSGIVLNRNFTEGSDVQAGQSLYQIDPATYQANYDSAKGELAKSEAAAAIAHLTVKRYVPLVGTKYISQQRALAVCAILGAILTLFVVFTPADASIWFLALLSLANSLMWPAIFPLAIFGLGHHTKTGSALLIMAIAGGAILPMVFGSLTSSFGYQASYWMLFPFYLIILYFAVSGHKVGIKHLYEQHKA